MGDMSKEPSMEEILSSIKRIIAEEGEEARRLPPAGFVPMRCAPSQRLRPSIWTVMKYWN